MKSLNHYNNIISTYYKIFGAIGLYYLLIAIVFRSTRIVRVSRKWHPSQPIRLRLNASDIRVFEQIFIEREYASVEDFDIKDGEIIDLGANIGLTSIFFSLLFPDKKIIAIEPDLGNFGILCLNISNIPNIIPNNRAVWGEKTQNLYISSKDTSEYSRQTHETQHGQSQCIRTTRIDEILSEHAISQVSILKIDIEGAEINVFSYGVSKWIKFVQAIIIELHERFAPGCNKAFNEAVKGDFSYIGATKELTLVQRQ